MTNPSSPPSSRLMPSIATLGFFRRMMIAFGLMVLIPLLVLLYIHLQGQQISFGVMFAGTAVASLVGFYVVWEIVKRVLTITENVQRFAPPVTSEQQDEGGVLQQSVSNLIQQMQTTMSDLEKKARLLEDTEQKLGEATNYSTQIIASIADYVLVTDPQTRITEINPAVQTLLGYGISDLKAHPIEDVLLGTDGAKLLDQRETSQLTKTGTLWGKSGMLLSQQGEGIPVQMNLSLMRDPGGEMTGIVIVARDIRETLRLVADLQQAKAGLEERVRQRTQEIEQAVQERERAYQTVTQKDDQLLRQEKMASLGQLAAGVAHEINNPVGFVSSNLQMLQEYWADLATYVERSKPIIDHIVRGTPDAAVRAGSTEMVEWLKKADIDRTLTDAKQSVLESIEGLHRVKKIVSALREFSHTDRDDLILADLNEGLDSTINIVWNELKYKVTLHKAYGDLPKIPCYPHQVNQVFMNLLVNAAQAIPAHGEIWVKTCADAERVYVDVRDTGAGIEERYLSKIFDPFFTTKPVGQGTGLGLSIVYGIIERHGGTIRVDSRLGEGTTFHLSFPIQPAVAAKAAA